MPCIYISPKTGKSYTGFSLRQAQENCEKEESQQKVVINESFAKPEVNNIKPILPPIIEEDEPYTIEELQHYNKRKLDEIITEMTTTKPPKDIKDKREMIIELQKKR